MSNINEQMQNTENIIFSNKFKESLKANIYPQKIIKSNKTGNTLIYNI